MYVKSRCNQEPMASCMYEKNYPTHEQRGRGEFEEETKCRTMYDGNDKKTAKTKQGKTETKGKLEIAKKTRSGMWKKNRHVLCTSLAMYKLRESRRKETWRGGEEKGRGKRKETGKIQKKRRKKEETSQARSDIDRMNKETKKICEESAKAIRVAIDHSKRKERNMK